MQGAVVSNTLLRAIYGVMELDSTYQNIALIKFCCESINDMNECEHVDRREAEPGQQMGARALVAPPIPQNF